MKMKRLILFNIVAVIVLLFAVEFATRTISWISGKGFTLSLHELDPFHPKINEIYKWHPFTGFTFNPNIKFTGSHPNQKSKASVSVDRHGFLSDGNTLDLEKGKNEIRIATIGGSTTANINLSFYENWPGHLGRLIQEMFPEKKISIINAGTPGFDTTQSIGNLALRVMPFRPDIVIIYHAYNDLKAIRPGIFKPDYSHVHTKPYGFHKKPNAFIRSLQKSMFYVRMHNQLRKLRELKQLKKSINDDKRLNYLPEDAIKTFENHIRTLVSIAKSGESAVILSSFATLYDLNQGWRSKEEALAKMSNFQKRSLMGLYKFTPGLTIPAIFDSLKRYNEVLQRIAVQEQIGWVDNAKLVPHNRQYFIDRVHFSKAGAKIMAENFVPVITKILTKDIEQSAASGSHSPVLHTEG
jgi:lysophospholipase L1-like esterase